MERMVQETPQLVLLDLMMPEMDGFEFLEWIRKHEPWRRVPVVVVTARDLTAEDRQRLNDGTVRILHKGEFAREELIRQIHSLIGSRQQVTARSSLASP